MGKSAKGLIFNSVHGSFVDGYGIRTTYFLKGCPLKCTWCCNPEGQSFRPELKVSYDRCNGCERCIPVCPKKALSMRDGIVVVDRDACDGCMECLDVCYTDALDVFGTWKTAEEVFKDVIKDEKYYATTGGGLTIGGGEATCYPEFVMEMIERCHENNISVAVDTCGFITEEENFKCLEAADLILFDIKGLDAELHKRNTGQSNDVILNNLKRLNDLRKSIIIRLPLIPKYNDTLGRLEEVVDFLESLKSVERIDILPMHEYGKIKYEQIGMPYRLQSETISKERQKEILELFRSRGLNAQIGG